MYQKVLIALARELRKVRPPLDSTGYYAWLNSVKAVENVAIEFNPRFKLDLFRSACGVEE